MKFISTNKLNALHAEFEKCHRNSEDFQSFVEQSKNNGKALCINIEEARGFLEQLHDEDYNYLLECSNSDFKFYSGDYLKRINVLRILLGAEGLTIKDIKEDRKSLSGQGAKGK
jgi:hypothetical protein